MLQIYKKINIMASIFDYQFNVGGNFTAAMDGMAESTATSLWVKSGKNSLFVLGIIEINLFNKKVKKKYFY